MEPAFRCKHASQKEVQVADADNSYWGPKIEQPDNLTAWIQGFGEFNSLHSTSTSAGISSTAGGGATGVEYHAENDQRLGVMVGAANDQYSANGLPQSASQNTYVLGIYGSQGLYGGSQNGGIVLDGMLLSGYSTSATDRFIALIDETAHGATDGYSVGMDVGVGYPIPLDEGSILTPRVGLAYTYSYTNGYTETGAPDVNLAIDFRSEPVEKQYWC